LIRAARLHAGLLIAYAFLAVVQTWPLALHLGTHLPGFGLGDNVSFVWNLWWMREAGVRGYFQTPMLFAPLGAPLVLHTHTALHAWLGATVLRQFTVVEAQNLLLIASLALNGYSGYLLAHAVTRAVVPSAIAGALLLLSPIVAVRLMGHFNLVAIWPLVLACLALAWWRRRPSWSRAIVVGVLAAVLPYVDYYFTVYFAVFVVAALLTLHGRLTVSRSLRPSRASLVWLTLAVAAFVAAAWIAWSSREQLQLGSLTLSLRTPTNALSVGWICLALALFTRFAWHFDVGVTGAPSARSYATLLLAAGLTVAALAVPLISSAASLWRAGDYVTSQASLRSGPRGVDPGTLGLGPPFSGAAGSRVRVLYSRLGIDAMESAAWVGWGLLVLAVVVWRARRTERDGSRWVLLAAFFAIWALGPSLILFTHNTGLILPQALARLIPIVNNARIPGRALLVVAICLTVVAAVALRHLAAKRRWAMAAGVIALAVIESIAAPLPLVALPRTDVYADIAADSSRTAVLSIPFGVRDGFGERGRLEHEALYAQTVHRHPIAGGFIARLPARIPAWYEASEPFSTLLRLSVGQPVAMPSCEQSLAGLRAANVGYAVLYLDDASAALRDFVTRVLPLREVRVDGRRMLFAVSGTCPRES
jgi:hypothetical protein